MGSKTELIPQIPVIDFSREYLEPGSSSCLSMCNQVRHALENYGCFIAKYDQLSPQLSEKLLSQTKDLFELPTDIKMKNTNDEPYRGYQAPPPAEQSIFFEGMGIDNARVLQETQKFMNLMWPTGKDQFCEVVTSYAKLLGALNDLVLQMVFESYGAGKHYASIDASNSQVLRFLKLKPRDTENIGRLPAHKDLSFATIVHQIDVPGLEVEANDGTWIPIQPQPSHFVFLACHGMQVWSNDRVKACKHRVTMSGNGERYSMGLFNFNNGVIQVPEEMVDDEHPLLYNPFDHPGFIRFFNGIVVNAKDSEVATKLQFDNLLKAFCGV